MPKPLPREVQNAIIAAVESGMPVSEVTVKFGVARRTIYYYLRRARLLATTPAKPHARRGAKSRLERYRQQILSARKSNPELTMLELRDMLKLPVSPSTLSRTIAMWELEDQPRSADPGDSST